MNRLRRLAPAAAVAVIAAAHLPDLLVRNAHNDLFIYRAGAGLALGGVSPYDGPALARRVAAQYPADAELQANHGFFLSPAALGPLTPFAALPWPAAKWAWSAVTLGLAVAAGRHLAVWCDPATRAGVAATLWPVPFAAVVLNPHLFMTLPPGQTSGVAGALLILGEVARRAGRPWLAAAAWAVPFAKPHLALALVPLAWFVGGWRHLGRLAVAAAGLTAAGCVLAGGVGTVPDYLRHLQAGHKRVVFNRVDWNPQITSWNRAVVAAGGPAVDLDAARTLAGYAAWAGLVAARVRVAGRRPSPAWAVAVAVTGSALCCQVLPYELFWTVAAVPLALDWVQAGRWRPAAVIGFALVLGTVHMVFGEWAADALGAADRGREVLVSTRSFSVLLLAGTLIVTGWPGPRPSRPAA